MARAITVLFAVFLLSACAKPIPPEQAATVVAGLSVTAWSKGMFGNPAFGSVSLIFQEYNPATEELIDKPSSLSLTRGRDDDCNNCKRTIYGSGTALSGHYVLRSINVASGNTIYVTDLYKTESSGLFGLGRRQVMTGSVKGTKLLRYHFVAGETAYIGDFGIDVSASPVRLAPIRRSDRVVLATLTKNSMPTNGFAFHPPSLQNPRRVNGVPAPSPDMPVPDSFSPQQSQPLKP